ncbi:MAG: hypothetical protein HC792_02245 [Acaryochloridaceae cyanobacterium CSU_5_19]|nr:hypothetical protein [Acaryochloridaceae cyanobacterium CSU_5_19]
MQDSPIQKSVDSSDQKQRRRRSKRRRAIYCPMHGCYLDSVSQKYAMFAEEAEHLQQRGMGRRTALLLMATYTTVPLTGEWLEAFWCDQCQQTTWYHVHKTGDRTYQVQLAPQVLWQQVQGVITIEGNPSVGEFTRKSAKMLGHQGLKGFRFL